MNQGVFFRRVPQHHVLCRRKCDAVLSRFQVHRTEFSALEGIAHTLDKAPLLFFLVLRGPILDDTDALGHEHLFKKRARALRLLVLFTTATSHPLLDPRAGLYQLRSDKTISPAARNCSTLR